MTRGVNIDGVLVTWGDRLFYSGSRRVRQEGAPKLTGDALEQRATLIRRRIEAAVGRRTPQVMVKVTGGGRCMRAIAAHLRYISKNGKLVIEDDRGEASSGRDAVRALVDDWRFSGSMIPEEAAPGHPRWAFNVMLSMPRGTDPLSVLRAAREFGRVELAEHKYVMVLHDHQANPHVHISVRAEGRHGRRLSPRKEDLHRWRETFAERLRSLGIDAEATRQFSRGVWRPQTQLWQIKAKEQNRLRALPKPKASAPRVAAEVHEVANLWRRIAAGLAVSDRPGDAELARRVRELLPAVIHARGGRVSGQAAGIEHLTDRTYVR